MRGAGITRYHAPQRQAGSGFFGDLARDLAADGWQGFKKGLKSGNSKTPNIRGAVASAKRGVKRAARRNVEREVSKRLKRGLDDLFGP